MKYISIIVLFLLSYNIHSQSKGDVGINAGMQLPYIALTSHLGYIINEDLSVGIGFNANSNVTFSSSFGVGYNKCINSENDKLFILTVNLSKMSSGIQGFYEEDSGQGGRLNIPSNIYLIPQLKFRLLDNGVASTDFIFNYQVALSHNHVELRSGDYVQSAIDSANKFIGSRFTFEIKVGAWFGK